MEPNKPQQKPSIDPLEYQSDKQSNELFPMHDGPSLQIKKSRKLRRWVIGGSIGVVVLLAAGCLTAAAWYRDNLSSPHPNDGSSQRITIEKGSAVSTIAQMLQAEGMIKNAKVFQIYHRFHGQQPLQAGSYTVARNLTVPAIIDELAEGKTREYNITFVPGDNVMKIREKLEKIGFNKKDIENAFNKEYPAYVMMKQRPSANDVEGFIFPDTYSVGEDYTVENILQRPFEHMQAYITEQKLEQAFKAQGLTLYEGITLASIIQKEVSNRSDMPHISQVFHSRLKKNMPLGSDPTFAYGARKVGETPLPTIDSPYNTYKIVGLPPGPITNPGKDALYAAAHPSTTTDDLYFVAGDDGKLYFSKTNEEHEVLTRQHCDKLCRLDVL